MFNQNFVSVVGKLVSNSLEVKVITPKDGNAPYEAITGKIVVRTADKSEIEVDAFAKRLTSTGAESKLFSGLVTVANEHKSVEKFGEEEADVIRVSGATLAHTDYKSKKDGLVKTINNVRGQFFKRLEAKDLENTPQEAKFELTGMITKIEDKLSKGVPTGDKLISLDVVEKFEGKEGKPDKYTLTPVKLEVDKSMASAFIGAGFMVGQPANLSGKIINIETKTEKVIKRDFGEDEVRVFTNYEKKNLVTGGNVVRTQEDICFTTEVYNKLVADRNLKLASLQNGGGQGTVGQQNSNPFGQADTNPFGGQPSSNPFANPFAQ